MNIQVVSSSMRISLATQILETSSIYESTSFLSVGYTTKKPHEHHAEWILCIQPTKRCNHRQPNSNKPVMPFRSTSESSTSQSIFSRSRSKASSGCEDYSLELSGHNSGMSSTTLVPCPGGTETTCNIFSKRRSEASQASRVPRGEI